SCHLSVLYRNKLIIVSQSRSPGSIALSIEEGSVFPLMETASGKVLLAFMPGKEQMEILNRNKIFNSFNKEDKKEYLQILKDIENDGYYFASSEQADGVTDITVPIGNDKDIIASLTVSILSMQLKEKILHKEILKKTLDTANKISKNLGFK